MTANQILSKIESDSGLNANDLNKLGINEQSIDKAIINLKSTGMSHAKATSTLLNLWSNRHQSTTVHASQEEMILLGYIKDNQTWTHKDSQLEITDNERLTLSFQAIENMTAISIEKIRHMLL